MLSRNGGLIHRQRVVDKNEKRVLIYPTCAPPPLPPPWICLAPMVAANASEAKGFCYNLLKFDPRRRWTVEEAIASPWIKRFAPGGPDASPPATAVVRSPRNVNASSAFSSSNSRVVAAEITPSTIASSSSASLAGTAAAAESPPVPPPDAARLAAGAARLPPPPSVAASSSSTAAVGGGSAEEAARQTGRGDGKSQEEEEEDGALGEMPQEAPISVRMLSSMRDYRSYGALRRTALMVVAYNQSPDKLRELRNEFVDFDTVSWVIE